MPTLALFIAPVRATPRDDSMNRRFLDFYLPAILKVRKFPIGESSTARKLGLTRLLPPLAKTSEDLLDFLFTRATIFGRFTRPFFAEEAANATAGAGRDVFSELAQQGKRAVGIVRLCLAIRTDETVGFNVWVLAQPQIGRGRRMTPCERLTYPISWVYEWRDRNLGCSNLGFKI